jgi:hypothetical protein
MLFSLHEAVHEIEDELAQQDKAHVLTMRQVRAFASLCQGCTPDEM